MEPIQGEKVLRVGVDCAVVIRDDDEDLTSVVRLHIETADRTTIYVIENPLAAEVAHGFYESALAGERDAEFCRAVMDRFGVDFDDAAEMLKEPGPDPDEPTRQAIGVPVIDKLPDTGRLVSRKLDPLRNSG